MPVVTADQLKRITTAIFQRAGARTEDAEIVSRYTVDTYLHGHDTHGALNIPRFVGDIRSGKIDPKAEIEVVSNSPSTALVDGKRGFGYVTATKAMELAIEIAKEQGIAAVGVTNCNHIGMLWGYAKMAVDAGVIGIVVCSSGPQGGLVVPFGGAQRFLGANPIAFGLPSGDEFPLIMDISTSAVAGGRVRLARDRGEAIPEGWLVDKDGNPSTDPEQILEPLGQPFGPGKGGAMLPFGGYKGYGLALLVEMLGGILTGYGPAYKENYIEGNGTFMIAIDVEKFIPLDLFRKEADSLFRAVKGVQPAPGVKEVLVPGEMEFRARAKREKEGFEIPDSTWGRVVAVAEELRIDVADMPKAGTVSAR